MSKRKRHISPHVGGVLVDEGAQFQVPKHPDGLGPVLLGQCSLHFRKGRRRVAVTSVHRSLGGTAFKRGVKVTRLLLVGSNLLSCRQGVRSGLDVAGNALVDLGFEVIGNNRHGWLVMEEFHGKSSDS